MKTESERVNKETEAILADAAARIQELEEMVARTEG